MRTDDNSSDRRALLGGGVLAAAAIMATSVQARSFSASSRILSDRGAAIRSDADLSGVDQVLVLRYDNLSPYCPVVYARVAAEPNHPGKFKASDGSWWELAETSIPLTAFGALGDRNDDTVAIENALAYLVAKMGGELIVPGGFFAFTHDVRILGNDITLRGTGPSSVLYGKNNARLILGNAILNNGRKAGTKLLNTRIFNLMIAPADNHAGECVLVDFADNTTFSDVNVGPWGQNGKTITHGIKTNWAQYTQWRNVSIIVNGYGIYIYLPKSNAENEDHFSIYSSWLYCGKTRNSGCRPSCIAVEREAGRHAAIFQFATYSTHLGAFMADSDDGRDFTAGLLCINPNDGTRTFHGAQFVNCMFEYVGRGIDLKSSASSDTSRLIMESCSFLGQRVCYEGSQYRATITSIGGYHLQCKLLVDGPHVVFEGYNVQEQMGAVSAQPLSYHRFAHKSGGLTSLSGIRLAQDGMQKVEAGRNQIQIALELSAPPDKCQIVPTWNTSCWIDQLSAAGFVVHLGSPPTKDETLFWSVEVGDR